MQAMERKTMQNYYIKNMEKRLTDEERKLLKAIYAPQVVAVPLSDCGRSMCVTPDGEIRLYGSINKKEPEDIGTPAYLSSTDCGLSWKMHLVKNAHQLGSAGYNPKTGRYITTHPSVYRPDKDKAIGKEGTWAIINDEGFDSENSRYVKISDKTFLILKNPQYEEKYNRWFIIGQYHNESWTDCKVVVCTSDDDGESWVADIIEQSAPRFEVKPPHKGLRWQQYSCEPAIAEVGEGEFIMIVRTSQDYHYMYTSHDGGLSWGEMQRTNFHGTITMPVLCNLSDGRIVFFWCNTEPMPELDHTKAVPPLDDSIINGIWEDVFTNRDANHLAISEDNGKTWIGMRELFLNTIRNNPDFRSIGGANSLDKSIHQAQIIELPMNKLLVCFGQNDVARKAVILDIDWLYERERHEDFKFGLQGVSTQMYIKSNLGGYRGFSGHCAYNRTNGALLVRDPDGNFEEAMQICRVDDSRLAYQRQGAVWNFPTAKKGRVSIKLRVLNSGVNIALTDHWYNPSDENVANGAHISYAFGKVNQSDWDTVTIEFDTLAMRAEVFVNGESAVKMSIDKPCPNGISYLHLQTSAEENDFEGTLIKRLDMSQTD